jgi:signal transduction histidine kinase
MFSQPNWYLFAPLFIPATLGFILSVFVLLRGKTRINKVFAVLSASVGFWTAGIAIFGLVDIADAYFWNKEFIFAAAFITPTFLHFTYLFCGANPRPGKLFLFYLPPFLTTFVLLVWPDKFVKDIIQQSWGKESILGDFYIYYGAYFFIQASWGLIKLLKRVLVTEGGMLRERYKLILIATAPSLSLGAYFNLILILLGDYRYIWIGPYFTFIFILVIAYAIVKYRLMDIKVAFTRLSIFITVYTIVLGIPIWIGFKMFGVGGWLFPIVLMALFATAGPFIYLNMQRRAESALLAEQMRYQSTLRQASSGMGRIRDLKRLLNLIVYILARVVRIEHALIYLNDPESKSFLLKASRRMFVGKPSPKLIRPDNPLIEFFQKDQDVPLIHEDIQRKISENDRTAPWGALAKSLAELNAELIFPISIHNELAALVVLGKKVGKRYYGEDDLTVFSILSSQAALAIENAQSYENMRKTHEQLLRAEKMATIGTMADGVAHQINNRFHCLGLISSDALDTINMKKSKGETLADTALVTELENALKHVEDNVYQGREIVRGLLQYTRHGEEGFVGLKFKDVLESAINMVKFKVRLSDIEIVQEIPADLPEMRGNHVQLQEVLFNLLDNAYDAMMSRKFDLGEEGFKPVLKISARGDNRCVSFTFQDNGIGVKDENKHKLFVPFFTTKATSKKGTGLGLYVIKKIIEENHNGETVFETQYAVGTKVVIKLPVFVKGQVPVDPAAAPEAE